MLIDLIQSHHRRQLRFQQQAAVSSRKAQHQAADKVGYSLVSIAELLAAKEPDICLRSWCKSKTELKESEYWTFIHQVARNTTPKEYYCCTVSAGCVCHMCHTSFIR